MRGKDGILHAIDLFFSLQPSFSAIPASFLVDRAGREIYASNTPVLLARGMPPC